MRILFIEKRTHQNVNVITWRTCIHIHTSHLTGMCSPLKLRPDIISSWSVWRSPTDINHRFLHVGAPKMHERGTNWIARTWFKRATVKMQFVNILAQTTISFTINYLKIALYFPIQFCVNMAWLLSLRVFGFMNRKQGRFRYKHIMWGVGRYNVRNVARAVGLAFYTFAGLGQGWNVDKTLR